MAGTRKRVLVLTSTFPRWEGDNEPPFVFELCRRLGDQFDVLVLAPHAEGAEQVETMGNVEVVRFRYFLPRWERLAYQGGILANLKRNRWGYLLLPFFFISQMITLWRITKRERIDLIHAHWVIPQGMSVVIAGLFKRSLPPFICTSHGGDLLGLNSRPLGWIKRLVIRNSSLLTVVSHATADRALSLGAEPRRLRIVPMGVDTRTRFTPDPAIHRRDNEILFVGRLVEKKGCIYLLEAMPEILRLYPDAHLRIVGSGPEEESLRLQVELLGIGHAVTFHGAVGNAEIHDFYRRAAVLVAPSVVTSQGDQEGLGLVLVEALACECPAIASDLPAMGDVISHGETGWIVRQKTPEAIASAVIKLLSEPVLRRQLAVKGRKHVMLNFDWEVILLRYTHLFDESMQRHL